mmetsp:Transcript_6336/g.11250  ORF Transcript_6336/g.11250 Transcript_6336/m.11250 type:complete len:270 (-) Transcript_6336:1439-2248(-)
MDRFFPALRHHQCQCLHTTMQLQPCCSPLQHLRHHQGQCLHTMMQLQPCNSPLRHHQWLCPCSTVELQPCRFLHQHMHLQLSHSTCWTACLTYLAQQCRRQLPPHLLLLLRLRHQLLGATLRCSKTSGNGALRKRQEVPVSITPSLPTSRWRQLPNKCQQQRVSCLVFMGSARRRLSLLAVRYYIWFSVMWRAIEIHRCPPSCSSNRRCCRSSSSISSSCSCSSGSCSSRNSSCSSSCSSCSISSTSCSNIQWLVVRWMMRCIQQSEPA